MVAKLYRAPLIIDLRDAWPDLLRLAPAWTHEGRAKASRAAKAKLGLVRFATEIGGLLFRCGLQEATLVITTSRYLEQSLDYLRAGTTTTICNSPVSVDGHIRRQFAGVNRRSVGPRRILYGGTVGRAQGISNAVTAMNLAAKAGADVTMRIIGQGAELERVRNLAEELDAPVEFFDPVSVKEMDLHYEWCDAVLVHLRDWEPLERTIPTKLIDAMARNLPVIVAANGEAADIVSSSGAGVAVPAMDSDALASLLIDWSRGRPISPDSEKVHKWLLENADPHRNGERFVTLVSTAARSKYRKRRVPHESFFQHFRLARHALEIGRDDPVHLATLVSRRLPPRARSKVTEISAAFFPTPALKGIAYVIGDERSLAEKHYLRARPGRHREHLGVYLNKSTATQRRNLLARQAWDVGEISRAISLMRPGSRTAVRWASVLRVLDPSFELEHSGDSTRDVSPTLLKHMSQLRSEARPESSAPIRVLHVLTNSFPHTESGYSIRSHAILRSQDSAGMVVAAVTRLGYPESIGISSGAVFDVVDEITYARLYDHSLPAEIDRRLSRHVDKLLEIVHAYSPDILHTTTNYENALVTAKVASLTGLPWVYETRGEMEQTWLSRIPTELYDRAAHSEFYLGVRSLEARMMKCADSVIALSDVQRASHVSRGIDPQKIHVVRNSIDSAILGLSDRTSQNARSAVGIPQAFTVGTVSSLVGYEGIDTLLRAIAILSRSGLNIRGAIVGDGASRPELQSLSAELGIADRVYFPGRVSPSESTLWYDAIDVFCIPRRDTDVTRSVTPIKPLQAMARYRPLVVSDLEALTEITSGLGAGLAVTPDDPIALSEGVRRLMEDRALYVQCAAAGRRAAEASTWDAAANVYASVYASILGGVK
ncbi:glycosyltransferase [Dietzia sp. MNB45]|uniref:glycosyltransferase n=1 Tax=Dietzia sp. MNB45 TaxID=3238800 RepID=UPI003F7EDBA4